MDILAVRKKALPNAAVGTMNNLSAEEIAAIMNHEKTSWGNDVKKSNSRRN